MSRTVTFKTQGSLTKTWKFLRFLSSKSYYKKIERYAQKGLQALIDSTPMDSGETANSWDYIIEITDKQTMIAWTNSNVTKEGTPVAILLQYGHATKNGGYVQGYDYINPAIQPLFEEMVKDIWREVTSA